MVAMSYLNLQMFWPRYIYMDVLTRMSRSLTVKHGHRQANGYAGNILEKGNHTVKSRKQNQTSVFSGSHRLRLIDKDQLCRASSNICTHKAGGYQSLL